MVNDEMMRIKNTSINEVFRGVFGTKSTNHISGTQIKKVRVVPVESRRNSLIRAANQTFEYVGFGQGNYSVALPEKQTKVLSTEDRKLGQTQKRGGGQNFYTGLNDVGEYFIGNKVVKGTTGEEEIFDAPITSVTGEGHDVYKTDTDAIKVTGGANKDVLSEFNGPSIFTNKLTSTSVDGIEAVSLQLQGDGKVARKITVGIATPSVGGAAGDVVLTTKPSESGYAGWIYTTQNSWRKFGLVSKDEDSVVVSVDKIGIGTTNPSQELDVYGSVNITGVLTATSYGNINSSGIVTASEFAGDGSALTGVIGIGSGFVVQDSGSAVGTAATVNFADNLTVQFSTGIATVVGAAGTDNIITDKLNVTGISTLQNDVLIGSGVTISPDGDIFATGITTVGGLTVNGDLSISGDITYDEITGRSLNVSGVGTVGFITASNAFYTGVVTATTFVGDITGDLTGDVTGNVTGTATNATNVTLADESTDTTCFPLFATGATGNLPPKTGTNLTFNSNTGDLAFTSATISDHTSVGSAVTSSESGIEVTGIITATSFKDMNGVGINTANVRTGILDVAGIATFRSNTLVGSGITLSPDGDVFATGITSIGSGITLSPDGDVLTTGITTIGKRILGISTNNIIPFLYNNYSDLPSASTYHGAFVHVHVAGKAFYAHNGAWYQLVNVGSELTVGLGTEKYNVGILTASAIKVGSGVTLSSDGDAFVTGISTATKFVGDLSDAVTSRWVIGANGTSHYTFTGPGGLSAADDPTIYLARGQTYEFSNQSGGSHPFQIRVSDGGSAYSTGVTNNGASTGIIKFEVPFAAPNTLVYQCTSHSSMLGNIVVYPSI
jgi:hypothetical protein